MARSRKRVKRKSNVRSFPSSQPVISIQKQNMKRKVSESETHNQYKRRRTSRYNLRGSNSVIFVGETPCCQNREQREKYTKLGLNTALFLKGTQHPKRKQSHISIITISSDDEETSEERTTEWVNSLDESCQSSVEPAQLSRCEKRQRRDKIFHPLCSSTPNITSTEQSDPSRSSEAEECRSQVMSIDTTECGGNVPGVAQEHASCGSPDNADDQLRPEQTFQLVISVPDTLCRSQSQRGDEPQEPNKQESSGSSSSTQDQVERCNKANSIVPKSSDQGSALNSSLLTFGSNSSSLFSQIPTNTITISSSPFYFGTSTVDSSPVLPFASKLNNVPDDYKLGSAATEAQSGSNRLVTNIEENQSIHAETNATWNEAPDDFEKAVEDYCRNNRS